MMDREIKFRSSEKRGEYNKTQKIVYPEGTSKFFSFPLDSRFDPSLISEDQIYKFVSVHHIDKKTQQKYGSVHHAIPITKFFRLR